VRLWRPQRALLRDCEAFYEPAAPNGLRLLQIANTMSLVPQVRPSVGLTWDHCARQPKRYRLEIESEWTARVPHPSIFCLGGSFFIGTAKAIPKFKTATVPVRQRPRSSHLRP
jgi:hypothetical protein